MAYLIARGSGRFEIRETCSSSGVTRTRSLAGFRGSLSPDVLERAAARASKPFDAARIRARASELGVLVTNRRDDRAARALLAHLRSGFPVDPILVTILRGALERAPAAPIPEDLADAAEWIGVSAARRGEALRGLLRVSDRIMRARLPGREKPPLDFPRFSSQRAKRGPKRSRHRP